MPVVLFDVRWPDGEVETCYSPSTIIKHHVESGRAYTLAEFVAACRTGLEAASARVRERYGGAGCTQAMAQLAAIERRARGFAADAPVRIETVRG